MNNKHRAQWLSEAKYGVFIHFLAAPASSNGGKDVTVEQWNERANQFDVHRFAEQLSETGAGYVIFTLGQNSGHYCSPNSNYDDIVGISPSKCSKRDLIKDLIDALMPKGIKVIAYLPSGAPKYDTVAVEKLRWEWGCIAEDKSSPRTGKRLAEFQLHWEAIILEWSLRWSEGVSGWWLDGCYFYEEMYMHVDRPNFKSFADALRAGNEKSILAFCPGKTAPVWSLTELDDYTAGELKDIFPVCTGRWVNGAQYHVTNFMGEYWGRGKKGSVMNLL